MQPNLAELDIKVLEKMYLKETRTLKTRLRRGAFLKNILEQENRAMELALAIHKQQVGEVSTFENMPADKI